MLKVSKLLSLFLLAFVNFDDASAFEVSPIKLNLDSQGEIGDITVKNTKKVPVSYQLQAFLWHDAQNFEALEPTDDLLAVPPIFEIQPGEQQLVRIATRRPLDLTSEQAYRAVISEVRSEVKLKQGVNFNFQVSLPIFVTPKNARGNPIWYIEHNESNKVQLVLENQGDAHLQLQKIDLMKNLAANPVFSTDSGGYIFPGGRRSWPLNLEPASLTQTLALSAETNLGPVESSISLPDG